MNILFTSHRFQPDIGGIETISQLLAAHFAYAGHAVRLFTQTPAGFSFHDSTLPYDVIRQPGAKELLAGFRWADVVFQNNIEARLLWPNLFFRKPLVIGLQTWIRSVEGQTTAFHRLKRRLLSFACQTVACSHAIRQQCYPAATVIGNPYNNALFRRLPNIQREKDVVFLGRLVSDKGAKLLLQAISCFSPPRPSLTIIGSGPEQGALQQLALDLQIAESVVFAGSLEGEPLVQMLNAHQVMVVPSLWEEPFGVVALEGIACGCALLVSDGGGLPDAVGSAGMLFQRGDVESLVRNLRLLLVDPGLRSRLQAAGSAHLLHFQPEAVASRYLDVLEQAVHKP